MRKHTIAGLAAAASLALAGAGLAAKPASSLSLVVLGDAARTAVSGEPAWGGEVTFEVASNETDRPFVNVRCYQGGEFVYDGWHGFFASYVPEPTFTLASLVWTGEAADCTARLVAWRNGKERTLAETTFHVAA